MTATILDRLPGSPDDDPARVVCAQLDITGPYDLREVALMGFGHRDETSFDGAMRMAFCLDGDFERHVGVEARQHSDRLELALRPAAGCPPLSPDEVTTAVRQVARVVSLDHDGAAFDRLCRADPRLAAVHAVAPGFRPALFYSPYEAAVWALLSARRSRSQAMGLRRRLTAACGVSLEVGGVPTDALPTPTALLRLESLPGLPADRLPRLHAVAVAAHGGLLSAERLRALPVDEALAAVQRLPGIGPFSAALIVVRACGHADAMTLGESHSRDAVQQAYGIDHPLTDEELLGLAEGWRPYRTWVLVMLRALGGRG